MAIENSVINYFRSMFVDSITVFDCHLSGVVQPGTKFGVKVCLVFTTYK